MSSPVSSDSKTKLTTYLENTDKITGLAYSTKDGVEYLVSSGLDKKVIVWGFPDREDSFIIVLYRQDNRTHLLWRMAYR